MKRQFIIARCRNCETTVAFPRAGLELKGQWAAYNYLMAYGVECCTDPALGFPGMNATDTIFLEVV